MTQLVPRLLTSTPTGIGLADWWYCSIAPNLAAHIDLVLIEDRLNKALIDQPSGYGKG